VGEDGRRPAAMACARGQGWHEKAGGIIVFLI